MENVLKKLDLSKKQAEMTCPLTDNKKGGINMAKITAWDRVMLARKIDRPKALDYINGLFDDFMELHGDRNFGDDKAIVGGIATFQGMPVTVIGEQKGKKAKGRTKRKKSKRKYGKKFWNAKSRRI